jgi:hypothetical protein
LAPYFVAASQKQTVVIRSHVEKTVYLIMISGVVIQYLLFELVGKIAGCKISRMFDLFTQIVYVLFNKKIYHFAIVEYIEV